MTTRSIKEHRLTAGTGSDAREIAVLHREGAAPGLVWLGGFRSDMEGTKAEALDAWGAREGHAVTRFDYSGHGRSGGAFLEGTISRWLEEALAVFRACTQGPQVLVGSSMGGWIALLLNKALQVDDEGERVAGLVLIAPALDMTKDLMSDAFTPAEWEAMRGNGRVEQPSEYSPEPYILTRDLIEDGERHLFGPDPFKVGAPVHILQGGQDADVPPPHAQALMERLVHDDAILTMVPDGDHRLSRDEDIALLERAVSSMVQRAAAG